MIKPGGFPGSSVDRVIWYCFALETKGVKSLIPGDQIAVHQVSV